MGCEVFGCFEGWTDIEYRQFDEKRAGNLDVQLLVWLIVVLAILVKTDLGDLSYHLQGFGRPFIFSPTVYAFKSGLYVFEARTEGIEDGVQPTVQGCHTCLWFESVSMLCYCLFIRVC